MQTRFRLLALLAPLTALALACGAAPDEPTGDDGTGPGGPFDTTADPQTKSDVDFEAKIAAEQPWYVEGDTNFCATGAIFDNDNGFCVAAGKAAGPFTAKMVAACKAGGGVDCAAAEWPIAQAIKYRGKGYCADGATFSDLKGVCVEGDMVIGPIDIGTVESCKASGGVGCETMQFAAKYLPNIDLTGYEVDAEEGASLGKLAESAACSPVNAKLASMYGSSAGYSQVKRVAGPIVKRLTGTPTRNGCATYLSVALRQNGVKMPIHPGTEQFRDELLKQGWTRVKPADLQNGDVVITADRPGWYKHPDHVYMFAGWQGASRTMGYAVDNQGARHPRNIGPGNRSRAAFGLRAPGASKDGACATQPPVTTNPPSGGSKASCVGKEDGWWCAGSSVYGAYQCRGGLQVWQLSCPFPQVCKSDATGKGRATGSDSAGFDLDCTTSAGECKSDTECASKSGTICIQGGCVTGKR
jgi:hypothetical protein